MSRRLMHSWMDWQTTVGQSLCPWDCLHSERPCKQTERQTALLMHQYRQASHKRRYHKRARKHHGTRSKKRGCPSPRIFRAGRRRKHYNKTEIAPEFEKYRDDATHIRLASLFYVWPWLCQPLWFIPCFRKAGTWKSLLLSSLPDRRFIIGGG